MPQNDFLRYEASGIAALLRTRTLAVPFYQRSYSWETQPSGPSTGDAASEKRQVADFWDDLHSSYSSKVSYFLGTVVLASGEDNSGRRMLVIDGQQRLATASLLLAAIRNRYLAGTEKQLSDVTQQDYLGKFDKKAKKDLPKIVLNTDDREFYEKRVVLETTVRPANYSQQLIESAYLYLQEKVDSFATAHGSNWESKLTELVDWLDESVQVVAIVVGSEADAFLIFETLNDRGADLTIADLLKNFLFSQADNRIDEVRDNWVRTLNNLGIGQVGNQLFTTFARHLLSSKYGLVREREVYTRLKGLIKGPDATVQFAQELSDASRLYYALLSADSDYWSEFTPKIADAAAVLVDLKIERYRPLVLAVMSTFSTTETARFITALVSWSVRMLCAGNLGGGVAEAAFCEAAQEIRSGKITTTEQILDKTRVGALVPSDPVFKAAFREWRVTSKLSRYLLRTLELEYRGDVEPELVVNPDVELVNLEHILPKNALDQDWAAFSADERKLYVDRLGNHALLQRGPNGRIGNKPWAVKRPVLANSGFKLTQTPAAAKDWTKEAIENRQMQLADYALTAWPREPRN